MSSPAPSPPTPLEDEDLLWEILLRLPPQPSSLPRASAVCKQWQRLATDPKFIAGFRAHHRKPPLLGIFHGSSNTAMAFTSILDAPDRIPIQRFDLRPYVTYNLLGCRHGHVLAIDCCHVKILVCDPVTGKQHHVAVPPKLRRGLANGAVLCPAADNHGHVHGGGCPFKMVLMTMYGVDHVTIACVYSSETGTWGDLVKTPFTCEIGVTSSPALVGNTLYWLQRLVVNDILVFDMDTQNLALIEGPPITNDFRYASGLINQAEDGYLVLAVLSYPRFQMWRRIVDCHAVATWVLWKTVEMHSILGLPRTLTSSSVLGYSQDTDAVFIFLEGSVYMVQLKSMQSKRLYETKYAHNCHPFTSFYTPGATVAGGRDGAKMLHNK